MCTGGSVDFVDRRNVEHLRRLRRRHVLRSPRLDLSGFGIVREVRSWIVFCICGGSHVYIVSGGEDKHSRQYLSK